MILWRKSKTFEKKMETFHDNVDMKYYYPGHLSLRVLMTDTLPVDLLHWMVEYLQAAQKE